MGLQLMSDLGETRGSSRVCPYAGNCSVLTALGSDVDAVEDRYQTVCTTDSKYDCSEYLVQITRALK